MCVICVLKLSGTALIMADTYLILVVVLFALAIFDLVVGVSNDAVNFLNSAIGSKVAQRRVIMVIASVGIFVGAAFSSGMMEVARKGVFNPEAFLFEEIMVVFIAVMITDIILLDLFNTFGMPTSTTVSIVFELLGAAVSVALIKMTVADQGLGHLSTYINGENALTIVTGILLSVVFAFTIGAVVMYFSRLLHTFEYGKKLKFVTPVWGGIALTAMTWFLMVKGLKNASFIDPSVMVWIKGNALLFMVVIDVVWTIILAAISNFTKFNILRLVVLFGTFALAMAFAGNDLVNFIGVPIAGFQSYQAWVSEGMPESMNMAMLAEKIPTDWYLLVAAGGIMVATLWFSKKARSVTETEIKLGRQDEGAERFDPNMFSRAVVRAAQQINKVFAAVLPSALQSRIDKAFTPIKGDDKDDEESAAFDMVRATVNLAVASMIISYASSRKLPLSTTYVSFMVAMGASLADRAWGRDSAVYRIAGVLNVVLGWFGTALIAFSVSAVFAFLIYNFGLYAVGGLILLAIGLVVRSSIVHRRREARKAIAEEMENSREALQPNEVVIESRKKVRKTLKTVRSIARNSISGLVKEDLSMLKKSSRKMANLAEQNEQFRYRLYNFVKRIEGDDTETRRMFLKLYDLEQDLVQSARFVVDACHGHVENIHAPLAQEQSRALEYLVLELTNHMEKLIAVIGEDSMSNKDLSEINESQNRLLELIDELVDGQVLGIRSELYGSRNSLLQFGLAFEIKDLVTVSTRFVNLYHEHIARNQALN